MLFNLIFLASCYDYLNRTLQKYNVFCKLPILNSSDDGYIFVKLILTSANWSIIGGN